MKGCSLIAPIWRSNPVFRKAVFLQATQVRQKVTRGAQAGAGVERLMKGMTKVEREPEAEAERVPGAEGK